MASVMWLAHDMFTLKLLIKNSLLGSLKQHPNMAFTPSPLSSLSLLSPFMGLWINIQNVDLILYLFVISPTPSIPLFLMAFLHPLSLSSFFMFSVFKLKFKHSLHSLFVISHLSHLWVWVGAVGVVTGVAPHTCWYCQLTPSAFEKCSKKKTN